MKKILPVLAILLAGLSLVILAPDRAQTQYDDEESPEAIMGMMGPMMTQMTVAMTQAMLETMAQPETAQQLATFAKNYHEALVAKGFSKDEALRILTTVAIPSFPSMN